MRSVVENLQLVVVSYFSLPTQHILVSEVKYRQKCKSKYRVSGLIIRPFIASTRRRNANRYVAFDDSLKRIIPLTPPEVFFTVTKYVISIFLTLYHIMPPHSLPGT